MTLFKVRRNSGGARKKKASVQEGISAAELIYRQALFCTIQRIQSTDYIKADGPIWHPGNKIVGLPHAEKDQGMIHRASHVNIFKFKTNICFGLLVFSVDPHTLSNIPVQDSL